MTVLLSDRSDARGGPRYAIPAAERRRREWSASWRGALRLAARDARRHRLASALILLMIGLPVMIVSGGAAVLATADVTPAESLPVTVGHAQALVSDEGSGALQQSADGQVLSSDGQPAPAVAGHQPGEPWTAAQVQRLTGGTVGVRDEVTAFADRGGSLTKVNALVLGEDVLAPSKLVELVSGRLPSGPGEVAVTEEGIAAGLPSSGPVELSVSTNSGLARVTGVVRAEDESFQPVGLVLGEDWLPADEARHFLVVRDRPVTWPDVRAWNAYGLSVLSPAVVTDPPAAAETPVTNNAGLVAIVVLICVGLVLETALLAGPAFAVSAARRRRSLAMIASNGARQEQLTRHVLAQGVLLGGIAVVAGALLGTTLSWWGFRFLAGALDAHGWTIGTPPLDTYGWATALVVMVAFVAAVISAAIPGHRAARLDIAATLAGREVVRTSSAGVPIAGAVIMGVGLALIGTSLIGHSVPGLYAAGFGGALLIIGSLFLLPALLGLLGRGLRRAPATLRISGRDTTRLRGRSVPAVAAITVVVAVLTMITISAGSDDAQTRRDYVPPAPYGHGLVGSYGSPQTTLSLIRTKHPTWRIEPAGSLGTEHGDADRLISVNAVPSGCAVPSVIGPLPADGEPETCQSARSDVGWAVSVPAPGSLNPAAALTPEQRAVLDDGGVLVTSADLIREGTLHLVVTLVGPGRDAGGSAAPLTLERTVPLRATLISPRQYALLRWTDWQHGDTGGAIMLATGADAARVPWTTEQWDISDPAGPISKPDQAEINDHVETPLEVERGYTSGIWVVLVVLFGASAALVAVGALISTALGQVEARAEHATLAALGAPNGFRRRLAAAQAAIIALVGTTVGILLGLSPGLALARSLTSDYADAAGVYPTPTLVIPWLQLGALLVAVPLACAVLAALMVRGRQTMTRRPS